jgi:gamma-glutamyltranspeptidase/glutathione hydrolase
MDTIGRKNALGRTAVATPGNLRAWGSTLDRFGTLRLPDVLRFAIHYAANGFRVTPYLSECVNDCAADLALDPEISKLLLPGGAPIKPGDKLINGDYAEVLRIIMREGTSTLYNGVLSRHYCGDMEKHGGYITYQDLFRYRPIDRDSIFGLYRGYEIVGPPPPSSGPAHIIQMLNILESYDIGKMGFGSADHAHVMAEALKIAFADRKAAMGDPDFVRVPVETIIDKAYAKARRKKINPQRARSWSAEVAAGLGEQHTTHLTVADAMGNVVATTQTINSLFGARYMVPETGLIPNNYMYLFDPNPGTPNSIEPGKRVTSSMSPVIVLRNGYPVWTVGLPGGQRIFPSVFQALVNLIDFGMSPQEAAEAPRLWTQGYKLELEPGFPGTVADTLRQRGHDVARVGNVGGGMSIIQFHEDGMMEGASCWRADGTPIGLGGGLARPGVRFRPEAQPA